MTKGAPYGSPDRIDVILADTRHAGNIGAVARVMQNFGLSRLTLVNPTSRGHIETLKMAAGAEKLVEHARIEPALEDALAGLNVTFAVTRRPRRMRKKTLTPEEAAVFIGQTPGRAGIVFGSEKWGLSNQQVALLDYVIAIPASRESPSLNLAQAAAIVLYQITRPALELAPRNKKARRTPADAATRRILYDRMSDTLEAAEYFKKEGNQKTVADIEDIFNRAVLDKRDVDMLLGVFRRIGGALGIKF